MRKIIIVTSLLIGIMSIFTNSINYLNPDNFRFTTEERRILSTKVFAASLPSSPKVGDIVYRSNFNDITYQKTWTTNSNIRFVKNGTNTIVSTHVIP